jgi:hypothetical protein
LFDVSGENLVGELTINTGFTAETTKSTATGFADDTTGASAGTLIGTDSIDST